MANASMSIESFLEVAKILPVTTSILMRGNHGIGKSKLAKLIGELRASKELDGIEREFIDIRLSQMTDGDMLGLPSTDGKVTRWNPMEWFQKACTKPCTLCLDELNRATGEVMQASFQIILDRELAGMKLHKDTIVISAINTASQYSVNEVDPALLDRFFVCDLVPTPKDWLNWAETKNESKLIKQNVHPIIVDFIRGNEAWLDTPKDLADPTDVAPSRRSWEFVSDALVKCGVVNDPDDARFLTLCKGFLGQEAALTFRKFAKEQDRQISAEDVLNSYTSKKVQKKLRNADGNVTQDLFNELIQKVASHCHGTEMKDLTDKQGKNVAAFMKDLPHELRIQFWTVMTEKGVENLTFSQAVHKYCGELVLEVFGVLPGEAGVGMVPNIPSMFNSENA